MSEGRMQRVAELVRQEIAKLLNKGVKDPRVGFVSVMGVRMSPDLRYANVYVSLYGSESEKKSSLVGLRNSAGWIRREIGKHLRMRVIPEVRFFQDESLDEVYRLEEVFESIHEEQESAPMRRVDLAGMIEELRQGNSFLITSHENPDGDAAGSMLGMAQLLKALGKTEVYCALADPMPFYCHRLPGAKEVITPGEHECPEYDTAVIMDVAQKDRIGSVIDWISSGKKVLVVDHHQVDEPWGDAGLIDSTYAAVGEMVVELFEAAEIPLTPEAAECAFVAQITDTGSYQYSNTNPRSHRIAAAILETNIDHSAIAQEAFALMSRAKFEVFQLAVSRIELACDGQVASSYVDLTEAAELGAGRQELEGMVNYCRNIEGVVAGVFFTGIEPEVTKVSFRMTEALSASEFAKRFGGGGHAAAAGATIKAGLNEAKARVLAELAEALGAGA